MAKASGKSITWVLLSEAKARAINAYQSHEPAERRLREWLAAGKLRWRSEHPEGSKREFDPGSGDPKFWVEPPLTFPPPGPVLILQTRSLIINWDESWVRRRWGWASSYTFYRIEVAEEDLAKLLPAGSPGARKKRKASQVDRVLPALRDPALFPGGVPDDMPTNVVQDKVADYLRPETKRLGISDPSWDSVDRALKKHRAK
jgi:hypothetical protein